MNKFVFQCSLSTDQVNLLKEFSNKIHINGDAVVQFEERGQFYFLCSKDSNLQQHYTNDNGWLITYSYPFNDELIIGQGLHESTTYAGYLHTFEDKDKVKMWNDILDFAFRSDFHRVFFPMENYFKGCLKLDNSLCFLSVRLCSCLT